MLQIKKHFRDLAAFDRRLWVITGVGMIVAVGFGTLIPFVAIYLEEQVGLTPTKIGLVMLVSAVVSASGRIIGGGLRPNV